MIYQNLKIGIATASYIEVCDINDDLLIEILNTKNSDEFHTIIDTLYKKTSRTIDFNCADIQKRKRVAMISGEKITKTKFIDTGIYNKAIYFNNEEVVNLLNEHLVKIKAVRWYTRFKPNPCSDFTWHIGMFLGLVVWYLMWILQYNLNNGG